jgi:hypothetical protein
LFFLTLYNVDALVLGVFSRLPPIMVSDHQGRAGGFSAVLKPGLAFAGSGQERLKFGDVSHPCETVT